MNKNRRIAIAALIFLLLGISSAAYFGVKHLEPGEFGAESQIYPG